MVSKSSRRVEIRRTIIGDEDLEAEQNNQSVYALYTAEAQMEVSRSRPLPDHGAQGWRTFVITVWPPFVLTKSWISLEDAVSNEFPPVHHVVSAIPYPWTASARTDVLLDSRVVVSRHDGENGTIRGL